MLHEKFRRVAEAAWSSPSLAISTSATLPCRASRSRAVARIFSAGCALTALLLATRLPAATPSVGEPAPDFTLKPLTGRPVMLSALPPAPHTVLVVLRGWPGYHCPFCTTQVYEYMDHAADFSARHARVILIYPGPSDDLQAHAEEFLKDKPLPENIVFLLDPNYEFTNRYSLRWEGKNETAYPSTFVLDRAGVVRFAHVSREHGDRVSAAAVLRLLDQPKRMSDGQ